MPKATEKSGGVTLQFLEKHHACDVLTMRPGDILTNRNVMYIHAALHLSEHGVFNIIKQRIPDIKLGGLRAVCKRYNILRRNMTKRPENLRDYAALHFATVPCIPAAENVSAADPPTPLDPSSSDDDSTAMTPPLAGSSTASILIDASPLSPVRTADFHSTPSASGSLLVTPVTPHGRTADMPLFRIPRTSPMKTRRHCLRCATTRKELRDAKEKHANCRRELRREIKAIHRRYSIPRR